MRKIALVSCEATGLRLRILKRQMRGGDENMAPGFICQFLFFKACSGVRYEISENFLKSRS